MLNAETKRRIDNARDILVGKVPDPKTQVEQITFAMIYKFMDDMDQLSVQLGGKASFFANGYEGFAWSKLMDRKISGADRLDLYVRALEQMAQNPHIPQLFRDVFKGAFLPYRDSETLNLFLKEMNGFTYQHSEDLGDAYEYLLSIFATQGKAGQFRTPRHIIDFIVDCVDPDMHDTVLDPACGTAGFLISAYKHILEKHTENPLTPDQKQRLTENFVGYDISPDMVRLSRVNMYLHQFPNPTIHEYDTLTTEDRWDDTFDVILANPPFMTPKGGIRPHKRFAVRANRSEVLFVDYIAEHLNVGGRAGVIVPEGIIFQSSNAYKALRKMLVEEGYLYAVVSLPAGIFQPYSGVKTSVLLMDKDLAKQRDAILFVKVENDGYDLGAQRNPIEENDIPEALELIREFYKTSNISQNKPEIALLVKKDVLGNNGDFNLSAERYRVIDTIEHKWPIVELGEICEVFNGSTPSRKNPDFWENGTIPWFTISDIRENGRLVYSTQQQITEKALAETSAKLLPANTVLICCTASVGEYAMAKIPMATNQQFNGLVIKEEFENSLIPEFLFIMARNFEEHLYRLGGTTAFKFVSLKDLKKIAFPLPPLEVQQEIVDEIEGYQKVIDGARQVVENYKPVIHIDPDWPLVKLGEVCEYVRGVTYSKKDQVEDNGKIVLRANNIDLASNSLDLTDLRMISNNLKLDDKKLLKENDIFICAASGSKKHVGKVALIEEDLPFYFGGFMAVIRVFDKIDSQILFEYLRSGHFRDYLKSNIIGANINNLKSSLIYNYKIPIPPIGTQKEIIKDLKHEKLLIDANRNIIELFEFKLSDCIKRIWEEG